MVKKTWHNTMVQAIRDIGKARSEVLYPSTIYIPISGGACISYKPDVVWLYGNRPNPKALIWEVETPKSTKTLCGSIILACCSRKGYIYAMQSKYGVKISKEVWIPIKYDMRKTKKIASIGNKRIQLRSCILIIVVSNKDFNRIAEGCLENCLSYCRNIDWDTVICEAKSLPSARRSIGAVVARYI